MSDKPTFWQWVRYLVLEWQHGAGMDPVIAMAIRMASHSQAGTAVYVGSPELARLANMEPRSARRLRKRAVDAGMFRRTGRFRPCPGGGRIEELEIAIPAHDRTSESYRDRTVRSPNTESITQREQTIGHVGPIAGQAGPASRPGVVPGFSSTVAAERSEAKPGTSDRTSESYRDRPEDDECEPSPCPNLGCGEWEYVSHTHRHTESDSVCPACNARYCFKYDPWAA